MSTDTSTANPLTAILEATERDVLADPTKADAVFRASGKGTGRVSSTIRIGKFTVEADEPTELGDGAAPNPVEYALAGFVSCQIATYRVWAVKLGIELSDIDVSIEGDLNFSGFFGLDDHTRPGYSDVRVAVHVTGPETAEQYAELQEAVDTHCPVLDLFSHPTAVHTTISVG